ncbi:type III restriction enzyme, res subunit [Methanoregula boonei 6A8]|jgi:type I restriction enzyme R subunit|uniref:Type III restriction enzyme, res subunit n=1 Tax=Methanoregula boonei (strain DSM 21154 / JCM 14090 / 6A8) TaxID=456442 RepID=A7I737_METB6|nr:type I restriction-modification enzyme R subunit C-terminal domain-containing protein [Methanoregula boonei]ABS55548.1 type III restriction enzyme, res subunit [Methanoregula boonei 6A8]
MSEEPEVVTRKKRIDPQLRAAGWTIAPYQAGMDLSRYSRYALEEFPTTNGPADYALCLDGKIVAVIEAKKLTLGPQNVLTQAERYAQGISGSPFNYSGFRVPFIYSTNGEIIWYHDLRNSLNRSSTVSHFHTPDALAERLKDKFESSCQHLFEWENVHPMIRPYQAEANAAIEQAIRDRKRQMLVAMATGTGKTYTMVNETFRLMESGVAKRILFLVDRRALAAQAVKAFASFEARPGLKFDKSYEVYSQRFFREDFEEEEKFDPKVLPSNYLLEPKPGLAFVYVCTIQRMTINLFGRNAVFGSSDEPIDEDAEQMDIPIHAFDLIIADECHRGYTAAEQSVWRKTLDHFDAIKIGLTATPAAHTMAYFREIVYKYDYARAVREGFLVDYDAVALDSNVRMNGIFLQAGEQVGVIDASSGAQSFDNMEDERQFDTTEVERSITSPDSNRKILSEIRKYAEEHEQRFGRFPKILIFAVNDLSHTSHADQLVDIARDVFGKGDSFVQKITGKVDRPLQHIREFRNRPMPAVVVTVDMLSTGVDIPDLEFIVFLRPVKSRILFEQMLGRGTRRGERCPDKSHFVVFDCFGGTLLDYFRQATGITAEPPEKETRSIVQVIKDVWDNRDRDYNIRVLVRRLQRIDKEMSGHARDLFAAYVPLGDLKRYASDLTHALGQDFTGTMTLLRNPACQDLLLHYPRPERSLLVAYENVDTVSSRYLIRDSAGHEYKPEDYLTAFSTFVKENPEHIEAIRILLDRPKDWGTDALSELKQKLAATRYRFTVENLQMAHKVRYNKALVDIISMVKHAAREEEPLCTAEQRIHRVFDKMSLATSLTPEQQQWLDKIREHLIANLSISKDDFDSIPIFANVGGWGKANRVFDGQLPDLIRQWNEAIAA